LVPQAASAGVALVPNVPPGVRRSAAADSSTATARDGLSTRQRTLATDGWACLGRGWQSKSWSRRLRPTGIAVVGPQPDGPTVRILHNRWASSARGKSRCARRAGLDDARPRRDRRGQPRRDRARVILTERRTAGSRSPHRPDPRRAVDLAARSVSRNPSVG